MKQEEIFEHIFKIWESLRDEKDIIAFQTLIQDKTEFLDYVMSQFGD